MSESSFNTVIVRDSRINDISTKLDVVVAKGSAQSNFHHVKSNTASNTNINFNITVPSENTIIDRNVTITASPTIRLTIPAVANGVGGVAAGIRCISYGHSESLNQFPLNSLFSNSTATINQCSTSVNTQDILHTLLKMSDDDQLTDYNCPHMSDSRFKNYSDMVLSESNALASFKSAKGKAIPRGSHPINFNITVTRNGGAVSVVTQNNTLTEITDSLTSNHIGDSWVIDITFTSTEPLLFLSPFIYGKTNNNSAGLYGVRNMDLVFNVDSSAKRIFCSSSPHIINVSLIQMGDCYINLNYLTTQASDLIASKNVVPFVDYARYITVSNAVINVGADVAITSNAIQLNQIPNRIYIIARKQLGLQTLKDSNSYLALKTISINFNNVSGILASANAQDLYNLSVANGSKQDLYEFLGSASIEEGLKKNTIGSILVINPARDLNLPDYLSNGSIGQFSFQANLSYTNTDVANIAPELVIITEYNGLFITQSGQSMKQTGLLTKDLVMNSTMSQFGESENYIKSFGSENGGNSNSTIRNVPLLNAKKSGGAMSGGAKSGGAMSGGAMSGGKFNNCV